MIFVTVGTGKFEELVKKIDEISKGIKEKIIVQIGKGEYEPKNCEWFRFKPSLEAYYKKARIIVTHGGAGTIFQLLKMGKKLIGVANLDRTDVHQTEILRVLSEDNYLIWCKNLDNLKEDIEKARNFKFKKYVPPKNNIKEIIENFISQI